MAIRPPYTSGDTLDEQLAIDLPEQVTLELPVAGFSMRIVAQILDFLIIGFLVAVIWSVAAFAQVTTFDLGNMVLFAVIAVIVLGYFLIAEVLMGGRTPGKAAVHIRVVSKDGQPPSVTQLIIRNLIRLADFALISMGVGLFVLFWSPRNQRMGDFAAGTLVVRDSNISLKDVEQQIQRQQFATQSGSVAAGSWVRRVEPTDIELLKRYLTRRAELGPSQRHELATRIVQHFEGKFGQNLRYQGMHPEEQVVRYWQEIYEAGGVPR